MMSSVSARPGGDDLVAWKAYRRATGAFWRTEPGISQERQAFLLERLAIAPEIERGIYPFKDVRLTRADVEWLLAAHQDGGVAGPISGATEELYLRRGLDLRGALLFGLDLSYLPLACTRFGLSFDEWGDLSLPSNERSDKKRSATRDQGDLRAYRAGIGAEAAAHLEGANFYHADLRGATFYQGRLEGVRFLEARMEGAFLREAHLGRRKLDDQHYLDALILSYPAIAGRLLPVGKKKPCTLPAASLHLAYFDAATALNDLDIGKGESYVRLADARWNGANLAVIIGLEGVSHIGDELLAIEHNDGYFQKGHPKEDDMPRDRKDAYVMATRANQQLSEMLRGQGINQLADRFAYRSKVCERSVLARQGRIVSVLISFALDALAGYGYHFWKSFLWYIGIIAAFAATYFALDEHETWQTAVRDSIYAFHGGAVMGFQTAGMDALALLPFAETLIGFIIAATFIAVYTQRFLSK